MARERLRPNSRCDLMGCNRRGAGLLLFGGRGHFLCAKHAEVWGGPDLTSDDSYRKWKPLDQLVSA